MQIDWNIIINSNEEWAYVLAEEECDIDKEVSTLRSEFTDFAIRIIRGDRCQTKTELFHELSAALQFPYYFSENWESLSECLSDLEWLNSNGYILIITQAAHMLRGNDQDFNIFIDVLQQVASEWAAPVKGEWERPAIPFKVIFNCGQSDLKKLKTRLILFNVSQIPCIGSQ